MFYHLRTSTENSGFVNRKSGCQVFYTAKCQNTVTIFFLLFLKRTLIL